MAEKNTGKGFGDSPPVDTGTPITRAEWMEMNGGKKTMGRIPLSISQRMAMIKSQFPLAMFPSDFGTHPADMDLLFNVDKPQWLQTLNKGADAVFGKQMPETDAISGRALSLRKVGGKGSWSNAETSTIVRAGKLAADTILPNTGVGRGISRAGQLYNAEWKLAGKGLNMSVSNASSLKSMIGDLAESSGYYINPSNGSYIAIGGVEPDKEHIQGIYLEAMARGLDPAIVAQEKIPQLEWEINTDAGRNYVRQREEDKQPMWQRDDGGVVTAGEVRQDIEKPGSARILRYVPEFMEATKDKT